MPQEYSIITDPETLEDRKVVNIRGYKKRISGYNEMRWFLILKSGMSKSEVDNLSLDELCEAYGAFLVFQEREKESAEESSEN